MTTRPERRRRAGFWGLLCLMTFGALLLRLSAMDAGRPLHADEAVHAVKFWDLRQSGEYRYDPDEFHGPTLYYATLPVVALAHRKDFAATNPADYRVVPVLFGAGMLLLLALFADTIGKRQTLVAAALLALSPAFVFYSAYYIQETLFVFFTLGAIGCGLRYQRAPHFGWAVGFGVCAGWAIASKETVILSVAAGLFAAGVCRVPRAAQLPGLRRSTWPAHAAIAVLIALGLAWALLSAGFAHPVAGWDYGRSFAPWLRRGASTDLHRHGWSYYLQILLGTRTGNGGPIFSQGFVVALGFVGAGAAFSKRMDLLFEPARPAVRFLAVYTAALTVAYSAIPYKTPWCVLSFLAGFALLAGPGAVALLRLARTPQTKCLVGILLTAGTAQLGYQAYRDSCLLFSDPRNPYVYAATAPEVVTLADRVEALARASPQRERIAVTICSVDGYYWPMPWYLRRLAHVGYWTGVPPGIEVAPVVIASSDFDEELTRRLSDTHVMTGYYSLRAGVLQELWVRADLWAAYLKTRKPDSEHASP